MSKRRRKRNIFIRPPAVDKVSPQTAQAAQPVAAPPAQINKKRAIALILGLLVAPILGILFIEHSLTPLPVHSWPSVPCKIVGNYVASRSLRPKLTIRYAYEISNQRYTNDTYLIADSGFHEFQDAYKAALKYPVGSQDVCRVNPVDHTQATLRAPLLRHSISIVLLFCVCMGLPAIWNSLRPDQTVPHWYLHMLALLLICIPAMFFWGASRSFWKAWQAKDWQQVPCVILGDYRLDVAPRQSATYITYTYELNGQKWFSNRYHFGSLIDNFHPAPVTNCYVNPVHPHEAVIDREPKGKPIVALLALCVAAFFAKSWWTWWRRER